jgi:hypothetical protein
MRSIKSEERGLTIIIMIKRLKDTGFDDESNRFL